MTPRTFVTKIRALLFIALALAISPMSFGASVSAFGTSSSCTSGPPNDIYRSFTCQLYNDASSYSFDLTPLLTEGGADINDNALGAGYAVAIIGDPGTLADDITGLLNQSLWAAVLYWQPDPSLWDGVGSHSLTVFWNGDPSFPTVSEVMTLDGSLYYPTGFVDSDFFVQYTPPETVYAVDPNEYDIYTTPEPAGLILPGSGIVGLGLMLLRRRRTHRSA
jgi:hypothetical protein